MSKIKMTRGALVLLASVLLAAPVMADAARTRPGGSGGGGSSGSTPTRVSGQATYRHGGHSFGHVGHGYGPYGYGYGYGGYYGWGGYPYFYGGYCGSPYYSCGAYPVYRAVTQPARDWPATLETDIRPRKATVHLDGKEVGQVRDFNGTWDVLLVESGHRVVEFRYDGYQTLRLGLNFEPGGYYRLTQRLSKGEGDDPRSYDEPPAEIAKVAQKAETAEAGRAEGSERPSALRHGRLKIQATPGDAAVYLDGEFLARADELSRLHGALPVAVGEHMLEIVRPGYRSERRSVDVGSEETASVSVRLQRADASR